MDYLVTAAPMYEGGGTGDYQEVTSQQGILAAVPMLKEIVRRIGTRDERDLIVGIDITIEDASRRFGS